MRKNRILTLLISLFLVASLLAFTGCESILNDINPARKKPTKNPIENNIKDPIDEYPIDEDPAEEEPVDEEDPIEEDFVFIKGQYIPKEIYNEYKQYFDYGFEFLQLKSKDEATNNIITDQQLFQKIIDDAKKIGIEDINLKYDSPLTTNHGAMNIGITDITLNTKNTFSHYDVPESYFVFPEYSRVEIEIPLSITDESYKPTTNPLFNEGTLEAVRFIRLTYIVDKELLKSLLDNCGIQQMLDNENNYQSKNDFGGEDPEDFRAKLYNGISYYPNVHTYFPWETRHDESELKDALIYMANIVIENGILCVEKPVIYYAEPIVIS